jgi:hypothetical protein
MALAEQEMLQKSAEAQPLGDIVGRLATDLRTLAKQEAELAKQELGEKIDEAKVQAGAMALGGAAVGVGALLLLAALVMALSLVMAAWLAALIVGAAVTSVGVGLLLTSKARISRMSLKPARALASMKRDVATIKDAAT